jgi:glycosyltransferase involved in cell wall biosynthesis
MIKILHITPDFNYSCGRSKLVFNYLKYFGNNKNYETHFITNGGDSLGRLNDIPSLKFKRFEFSTGYKNIFYYGKFYTHLKEYIINNKIDLIHTHHRFPEMVSVKIGLQLNVKTILSTHGFTKGYTNISFRSDKIISVSRTMTDYLIEIFKVNGDKIITLYNPAEPISESSANFSEMYQEQKKVIGNNKVLLFVGRMNFEKGVDSLLNAFDRVSSEYENVILITAGQMNNSLKKNHSIVNNKKIINISPQKDIGHLYSLADIVILPSRSDSFPYVMLEAGIFKKSFIGGNTGGIAEFIENGKNGFLIDPENPEHLAEKILYLLNNPDVGEKLGENLHQKVKELCDYNSYFSQVEKIYNELIEAE